MKATGIVRRIDDLGRVVIPKEIRRTMRIREGDPLEIFIGRDGEVILKKYSPMGELLQFAKEYAEAINDSLGQIVFIADRDTIIATSGILKKDFLNKPIGATLEKIMEGRRTVTNSFPEGKSLSRDSGIIQSDIGIEGPQYYGEIFAPVIAQGDVIGAVIICNKNGKTVLGDIELKVAETAAGFLARQIEE